MIKKFIVSMALLGTAIAAQANITTLRGFYIDKVDPYIGGDSVVHYDDGSLTWSQHFRVHIAPYAQIFGNPDPDFTVPDWITPVVNGGATFAPYVELFAAWGSNNEVLASSMGNGLDASWTGWEVIGFAVDNAAWDVTITPVISAVPEPESYALMLASLGILAAVRQKSSKKTG